MDTAGNDKGFLNYVEAEKWAKEHLCKVYTDEETGGKGEFSIVPKVINKYVSKAARDKSDNEYLHYVVLQNLPSIIHDSIDTETHPNFTSHGAKKKQVFSPMTKIRWFMCYMVQLKLEISFVE